MPTKSWRRSRTKVGRLLQKKRREAGWTQADAAKRVGYSRSHFNHIERGHRLLEKSVVDDWAHALGIDVDELMHAALEDFLPSGWGAHQT